MQLMYHRLCHDVTVVTCTGQLAAAESSGPQSGRLLVKGVLKRKVYHHKIRDV